MATKIIPPPVEPKYVGDDFIEEWRRKPHALTQPVQLNEYFYSFLMTIAFGIGILSTVWALWELFKYLIYLFVY